MKGPNETIVETPLGAARVWRKGRGKKLGFLAGLIGLPRWTPFLDKLAETRRVVVPSLPGFPGGPSGDSLDTHLDWIIATYDTLAAAQLLGADLIGASLGGALAAEVAALWPQAVRRLVLVAPLGIFDANEPGVDVFAQRPGERSAVLSAKPAALDAWLAVPEGEDPIEWEVMQLHANIAAAKILWPFGDTRLAKRLPRVEAPTLLVRGENDRVVPPSYVKRLAAAVSGPTRIKSVRNAGHLAAFDEPAAVARAVQGFLAG